MDEASSNASNIVKKSADKQQLMMSKLIQGFYNFNTNEYMTTKEFRKRYAELKQMLYCRGELEANKLEVELMQVNVFPSNYSLAKIKESQSQTAKIIEKSFTSEKITEMLQKEEINLRIRFTVPVGYVNQNIRQEETLTYEQIFSALEYLCKLKPDQRIGSDQSLFKGYYANEADIRYLETQIGPQWKQYIIRNTEIAERTVNFKNFDFSSISSTLFGLIQRNFD